VSVIDVLLVGAVLIVALWWIAFPNRARRALRLVPLALLALAVLQIAAEGFYWQTQMDSHVPSPLIPTKVGIQDCPRTLFRIQAAAPAQDKP